MTYQSIKGISKEELNNIILKEEDKDNKSANELKNILEERLYYYKNLFLKRLKEDSFHVLLREELIKAARNKQKGCYINVINMDKMNRLCFKEEPYLWGLSTKRTYHSNGIIEKTLKKLSPIFKDIEMCYDPKYRLLYSVKGKDDSWRQDFKHIINHNQLSLNTLLYYLCNFEKEVDNILKVNNFDLKFNTFVPDIGYSSGTMYFYWL